MSYQPNNNYPSYRPNVPNGLAQNYNSIPQYGLAQNYNPIPQHGSTLTLVNVSPLNPLGFNDSTLTLVNVSPLNPLGFNGSILNSNVPQNNKQFNTQTSYTHNGVLRKKSYKTVMEKQLIQETVMTMVNTLVPVKNIVEHIDENGKISIAEITSYVEEQIPVYSTLEREIEIPVEVEIE